jgi:hypothetical protein
MLVCASVACEGESEPPPASSSLVELEAWERVEAVDEDVFGAERPEGLVCDEVLGIGSETVDGERVLEISTELCNYATVRQPSLRALKAGDTVTIQVLHEDLTAPAPTEAHLALAIDGAVAWEHQVPVPAAGALVEGQISIDADVPAGTELQFHVHNHGNNTYDLLAIEVAEAAAERSAP